MKILGRRISTAGLAFLLSFGCSRAFRQISQDAADSAALTKTEMQCCCKAAFCSDKSSGDDGKKAIYSPNRHLCCKVKSGGCYRLGVSGYRIEAPQDRYCSEPDPDMADFPLPSEEVAVSDVKSGTPAHTIQNYCNLDADDEASSSKQVIANSVAKTQLIQSMVKEVSQNSLDAMAKDIFSIYVCMSWAPSSEFVEAARGEIETGQLAEESPLKHFADHTFVPLRCTKNVNVYGDKDAKETSFESFEKQLSQLARWFDSENGGAVSQRLQTVRQTKLADLGEIASAFDLSSVQSAVSRCPEEADESWNVNAAKSATKELLSNCRAARWWQQKLRTWHAALPFTSFMSPDAEAAKAAAPKANEQVLICFGKRVASQLHRRANGSHLLTDQSAVGCHGFWDMATASNMLDRIVKLWRPPTCQLASMELDMKLKIMELMATMNSQLFDALPALLTEEMAGDEDNLQLKASSAGTSVMVGLWQSITKSFSSLEGQYTRLGQLLGKTVVKWVVCPLKNITDENQLGELDAALGTEDDSARYYAEVAYAKWTGKQGLLPGESCQAAEFPETQACSLGIMQQDMPEKYRDVRFICPVRPLLPAPQQLKVFQAKEGQCLLHMNAGQMASQSWFYRGRQPQKTQYEMVQNLPKRDHQAVKILSTWSRQDSNGAFHKWRAFVTLGLHCTLEEAEVTPRWCAAPDIYHASTSANDLLNGLGRMGNDLARGAHGALHALGATDEKPIKNNAFSKELGNWLYGAGKGVEEWLRDTTDEWMGRASRRYNKLYDTMFMDVETADLLHSASYQKELEHTGADSQGKQRYDRYAVVAPCKDFKPNNLFRMRFRWSEHALQLAKKAAKKFGTDLMSQAAFTVQLQGAGMLDMQDEEHAWITFSALVRAGKGVEGTGRWMATKNPFLEDLAGSRSAHSGSGVRASDLRGFQAYFTCGSRKEMHDLSLLPPFPAATGRSFRTCVEEGIIRNADLRKAQPDAPFLRDEIVVRVTFAPLQQCVLDVSSASGNETENPVYKSFAHMRGCAGLSPTRLSELPAAFAEQKQKKPSYRGLLLGSGLVDETLLEVIIAPEDFQEVI